MATLAVCVWTMTSEINGALQLARTWDRAGHQGSFIGVADGRPIVVENGFRYLTVLEDLLPRGSIGTYAAPQVSARVPVTRRLLDTFQRKRRFEQILTGLVRRDDNPIEAALRALRP